MKRYISMLLLGLVALSSTMIVGCGPKEEAAPADGAAAPADGAAASEEERPR